MDRGELARTGCRLLAVYAVVGALGRATSVLHWMNLAPASGGAEAHLSLGTALTIGLLLTEVGVAAVLWFGANRLASRMVGAASKEAVEEVPEGNAWATVLFSAVGLCVLAFTFPTFLMQGAQLIVQRSTVDTPHALGPWELFPVIEQGIQVAIGVALFFGSRGLANLVRWARRTGVQECESVAGEEANPS